MEMQWASSPSSMSRLPVMLNWYVVHRNGKRLPPVAQAFKEFLIVDGATQIASGTAATSRFRKSRFVKEREERDPRSQDS